MFSNGSRTGVDIKRILVPVDFSDHSVAAVEHAVSLAEKFGADLSVIHVIPTYAPPIPVASGVEGTMVAPPADKLKQRAAKSLAELGEQFAPGKAINQIAETGDPASVISESVKKHGIDFIVMPTRGYGIFRRLVLGSVTTKVLNDVDCPILTGAHVEELRPHDPRPYEHVGCAVDLTEKSAHTLQWASGFAQAYGARLSVIHAVPVSSQATTVDYMTTDFTPLLRRNAEERVHKLVDETSAPVAEAVIETGSAESLIPSVAREQNLDALVIGRHDSSGLFGGLTAHAYSIIRHSPCPVISV